LDEELKPFISELDDQDEPYVDSFGRVTYFTAKLGGQTIPIYQTGSLMFESAVKEDSQTSVVHNDSQQNGIVLGNSCALFLAKFTSKLI
jgi:ribonuclease HIII